MSRRLVIPAGDKLEDLSPYGDGKRTWLEVGAENTVDGVEVFGSQWCVDNDIDGLGICTEKPPTPEPPLPPDPDAIDVTAALAVVRLIDQSSALTVADLRAAAAEAAGVA
jgi:hypothetical protein